MPFALVFSETAVEDLGRLVDSLPPERQDRALVEIEARCRAFAERPQHKKSSAYEVPTFPVRFVVDEVVYYWVAAYNLSPDETTLEVRHVFRTAF